MGYEILSQIGYGRAGNKYLLKVGEIVPTDFFLKSELPSLIKRRLLKPVNSKSQKPVGKEASSLENLESYTIVQCKEILEKELDAVRLERYLDQVRGEKLPRSSLLTFVETKIRNLAAKTAWD